MSQSGATGRILASSRQAAAVNTNSNAYAADPTNPDRATITTLKDGPVSIYAAVDLTAPGGQSITVGIFMNGVQMKDDGGNNLEIQITNGLPTRITFGPQTGRSGQIGFVNYSGGAGDSSPLGLPLVRWLAAGTYTFELRYKVSGGTGTYSADRSVIAVA